MIANRAGGASLQALEASCATTQGTLATKSVLLVSYPVQGPYFLVFKGSRALNIRSLEAEGYKVFAVVCY